MVDLIRIPAALLAEKNQQQATGLLQNFLSDITGEGLEQHVLFKPTYIHIRLDNSGEVTEIDLKEFSQR